MKNPRILSEVSARLHAELPELRLMLAEPEITISSEQIEQLLIGTYLIGFGAALSAGKDDEILAAVNEQLAD